MGKESRKKGTWSRMTLVLLKATQNGSFGKSWDMRFGKPHGGQEGRRAWLVSLQALYIVYHCPRISRIHSLFYGLLLES